MNRRERRAALKQARKHVVAGTTAASKIESLVKAALRHHASGEIALAENCCRQILALNPAHVGSLNMLGAMAHEAGRNNEAIKLLCKALALDATNAACHDNIALAYQAIGRREDVLTHFTTALALGVEDEVSFARRNPAVNACVAHMIKAWPRRLALHELFQPSGVAAVADDAMLESVLRSRFVCDIELERFLTAVRAAVLDAVFNRDAAFDDKMLRFLCALAHQCFINEYVFASDSRERARAEHLRQSLIAEIDGRSDFAIPSLIAVGSYFPLHTLPNAKSLTTRSWSPAVDELLVHQVREPLEEHADRPSIPVLTPVDDRVSMLVRQQYEENPYPRWRSLAPVAPLAMAAYLRQQLHVDADRDLPAMTNDADILIAGCGTGSHPITTAQRFPNARVLAIDISLSSLAYARRKTRESSINNISYAQADILNLGSSERAFDLIESIGVLHHLADPERGVAHSDLAPASRRPDAGWALQRARPPVRRLGAQADRRTRLSGVRRRHQGLQAGADRPQRGALFAGFLQHQRGRDLFFHVMEHRFSLPDILDFLGQNRLRFLGFELEHTVMQQFRRRFPTADADNDLDRWHTFETENPRTFMGMYRLWLQKPARTIKLVLDAFKPSHNPPDIFGDPSATLVHWKPLILLA